MSSEEWDVHLEFSEGSSNKFWRARKDGETLYVNYGRIGSKGQMQVKDLGSEAAVEKELAKLEKSKRKKGYVDTEGEEPAEPAAAAEQAPEGPVHVDLALTGDRKIDMRLTQDGDTIRTVVVETYDSPEAATAALKRLAEAMADEGYKTVAPRGEL